jgi:hypothetical protein
MALSNIEQPNGQKEKDPTTLENAAKVLGILTNVGSLGTNSYDTFVNKPNQTIAIENRTAAIKAATDKGLNIQSMMVEGQ